MLINFITLIHIIKMTNLYCTFEIKKTNFSTTKISVISNTSIIEQRH